jgi:hypothetical protein
MTSNTEKIDGLSPELLPCPFCGGKAHWPEPEVNIPYVGCTECGACIQDEVRWNTRTAHDSAMGERVRELEAILNTPEVEDWAKGCRLEAAHQRERWGVDHDAGKSPFDWFWLVGYLAQKAAASAVAGDTEKAKHHTISTGAALANWHLALCGADTQMRPGIGPGNGGDEPGSAYALAALANQVAHP